MHDFTWIWVNQRDVQSDARKPKILFYKLFAFRFCQFESSQLDFKHIPVSEHYGPFTTRCSSVSFKKKNPHKKIGAVLFTVIAACVLSKRLNAS